MAAPPKPEEEYEPYHHYENDQSLTYFETLFHLLKGAFGTGVLAFPKAFHHAGYIFGVIGAFVMGAFCTYCLHMLERTEYKLCKARKIAKMTYPQTATAALEEGPWKNLADYAPFICNAFIIFYQMGSCVVYFIFISENIQKVIESQFDKNINLWIITCFILPAVIFINWIKSLKWLAPLSAAANIITVVSIAIIFYYFIREGVTFQNRNSFGDAQDYPLFVGTCCFAMVSIGVVMPLKNNMKNARKFGSVFGIINVGMTFIIVTYTCIGFFGYLAYGENAEGSISYTIGGSKDWLADSCKILLAFAIFITHALALFIVIDIIWNQWLLAKMIAKEVEHRWIYEYLIRTCLVIITWICAAALPYIEVFISLVGSICIANLAIAFPAIMDSSFNWYRIKENKTRWYWVQTKNLIVVVIGIFVMVVGIVFNAIELVKHVKETYK